MDVLWRMLGFYPGEATRHNDVVRMAKHADGYAKEIKTAFIDSIRRATAAGNMTDVARIKADVRQWNQTHGPASVFYIRDFGMKAARAVREGKRTTSARYLKSAPRNVRPHYRYRVGRSSLLRAAFRTPIYLTGIRLRGLLLPRLPPEYLLILVAVCRSRLLLSLASGVVVHSWCPPDVCSMSSRCPINSG